MKMQLSEIARALEIEAKETWEDITITSVSFDSRQLEPGALFVPLIGEQDGHRYVQAALDNGASAVLWQADHPETNCYPSFGGRGYVGRFTSIGALLFAKNKSQSRSCDGEQW